MDKYMTMAIEEARSGVELKHGGPFGAVIVKDNQVIAKAHNTVIKENDPTCHAEINAIRLASRQLKTFKLNDCILFTSSEPCPMCLSAILWSGIQTVYYGCTIEDAKKIGFADEFIYEYLKENHKNNEILKLKSLLREDALEAFKIWDEDTDKVPY